MILVIDDKKKRRDTLLDIFYYMGLLAYGTDSEGAFREVSTDYRAILISEPEELGDAVDYLRRLARYSGGIPIFSVSERIPSRSVCEELAIAFPDDVYSSRLVSDMINYLDERGLDSPGKYLLAGIDAGCDLGEVRYMSEPLPFTKTETMILRYLILTYPRQISAGELLSHAFKPGRAPEPSCIRTHISSINKKFTAARGRTLVSSVGGEGYAIMTPELIGKK